MQVVKLHEHSEFLGQTAELLNSHWKKSLDTRLSLLKQSNDSFPINFVGFIEGKPSLIILFIVREQGQPQVVAHVVLLDIVEKSGGIYLESLIVSPNVRGRGFGKQMMEYVEDYARNQGATKMWLNTKDKQQFYQYLGYKDSGYVSPVRESQKFLGTDKLQQLNKSLGHATQTTNTNTTTPGTSTTPTTPPAPIMTVVAAPPAGPKPPAGPPTFAKPSSLLTWMNKDL